MESLRGKLLVAEPALLDPNFRRTVVLVLEHDDEGALGLVLNRPSETAVAEVAPELVPLCGEGAPVHAGGPVAPEGVVVLAEFRDPAAAASLVLGDVGLVAAGAELTELESQVRRARVYAGHAGWAPGQLDAEIEADGWIVEPPARDELFAGHPAGLWSTVLARKGGRYALVARMPLDPSLN